MINPLDNDDYYILLNEYNDLTKVISDTYEIMKDSLDRILKIKEDLINLDVYNIDEDLYNKILNMETLISSNIKQLEEKNINLTKVNIKLKR